MKLLSPLRVAGITLRNRIAMAPMTREFAPEGIPTPAMAAYYRRRAAGGAGLIITEGTSLTPEGSFGSRVPRMYGADALGAWKLVVQGVHAEGAAMIAQLWHVGAFDPSLIGMQDSRTDPLPRVSPSGLAAPGRSLGRVMTKADIDRTITAYALATNNAKRAGFDGIEIHAAHGYLPDQFLWQGTNLRDDRYGGSLRNRVRFACEVVAACRCELGPALILSFRLSQWKQLDYAARIASSPGELAQLVEPLCDVGVDVFHGSSRRYWEPAFAGSDLTLAGWLRRVSGKPSMAVGSVTLANDFKSSEGKTLALPAPQQIADLERRLDAGEFDLIAIGRALLANADWVHLVAGERVEQLKPFSKSQIDVLF